MLSLPKTTVGSLSYSITFFMYGVMITTGFIVHCLYESDCGKVCVCVRTSANVHVHVVVSVVVLPIPNKRPDKHRCHGDSDVA